MRTLEVLQSSPRRILRGQPASFLLRKLGIDPKRFWLLMDLFDELSERGEMLDQLGRNGVALKVMSWIYAGFTALMSLLLALSEPAPRAYLAFSLFITAFFLLTILLSEAGNSLVNPDEALILAHQPIDGATYVAAKLAHLTRIVFYFVPAINLVPALVGLMLKTARWYYPFVHMAAALVVGIVTGLFCCALYGWLTRLVPASRLKAAAQLVAAAPLVAVIVLPTLRAAIARMRIVLPHNPLTRVGLEAAVIACSGAIAAIGIRSLSADYLIRVSAIVHGKPSSGRRPGPSVAGNLISRLAGQSARAGFHFVSKMVRRDFQFRRQALPMLALVSIYWVAVVTRAVHTDPFSRRFAAVHTLPHMFGLLLFFVCSVLAYGNEFHATSIFRSIPDAAFKGFARGVHFALWIAVIGIPHMVLLLLLPWYWGAPHAVLFVVYSAAVSSAYLALELRLIDGIPFSKPVDPKRGAVMLPVVVLGTIVVAIAVAVQYFFVFRGPVIVAVVTLAVGAAACLLARSSAQALELSMRYELAVAAGEAGARNSLYQEIDT